MGAWPCAKCGSMMFTFNFLAHDCIPMNTDQIPVPEVIEHTLAELRAEMPTHKHRWQWVWVGGEWTNRVRCSTCGEEREAVGMKKDTTQ